MTKFDKLEKRCPMLGHMVHFKYCRSMNPESPCRKILDCWFEQIPVQQYIQDNYSKTEIEKILTPPKPKVVSILELIEQAKAAQQKKD